MSVIGLDIGNENCVVAVEKQRNIDVVLNDESNRETPAVVCFGEKQRFLGTVAVASATMNPKSTISQIKRLIRRRFSDTEVQNDLRLFPFKTSESFDGAIALSYGIYKTDLHDNEQISVVIVDVGHSDTQVSIAAFKKGQLMMLTHAFDRCFDGRDFDEVLFNHFARRFTEDYRIDVLTYLRASSRLRSACEKLKKILSANAEAPLNIECLMEEMDVRGFIKRDEFERLSSNLLERIQVPCQRTLVEAQLGVDKIYAVEVVRSGSRIPAVLRVSSGFFGKELSRTLNASESIARGWALQCAMLSPTFRVREFQVCRREIDTIFSNFNRPPEEKFGDNIKRSGVQI